MADNFLERRMEDYRRGLTAPRTGRQRLAPGRVTVSYERRRVAVEGALTPVGREMIRSFIAMGCKVSFVAPMREGRELASLTASECHPDVDVATMLDRLASRQDPASVLISCTGSRATVTVDDLEPLTILLTDGQEPEAAALAVLAASPRGKWLAGREIEL